MIKRYFRQLIASLKRLEKAWLVTLRIALFRYTKQITIASTLLLGITLIAIGLYGARADAKYDDLEDRGLTATGVLSGSFGKNATYRYTVNNSEYKHTFFLGTEWPPTTLSLTYLPEQPSFTAPAKGIELERRDMLGLCLTSASFAVILYFTLLWANFAGVRIERSMHKGISL